jgi:hypothetical protein
MATVQKANQEEGKDKENGKGNIQKKENNNERISGSKIGNYNGLVGKE